LIARRPGGELFWSIRHGVGAMPPTTQRDEAAIWSLVDFIRLRAGARIFTPSEMGWADATRMPGFVARCADGSILAPGNGTLLQVRIERDDHGARARALLDGASETCPVEDPEPLAAALAELTGSAAPPALVLVDANGWARRAIRREAEVSPSAVASALSSMRERPLDGSSLHH
jgi:hypothetical protein